MKKITFCGDFRSPIPVKLPYSRLNGNIDAVFGNTEDRMAITKLFLTEIDNLKIHGESAHLLIDGLNIAVTHYPDYAEGFANSGKYDLVCHGHTYEARWLVLRQQD